MKVNSENSRIRTRKPVYVSKVPDPSQNGTDPEHCFQLTKTYPGHNKRGSGPAAGDVIAGTAVAVTTAHDVPSRAAVAIVIAHVVVIVDSGRPGRRSHSSVLHNLHQFRLH